MTQVSFEFFPPKTDKGFQTLLNTATQLAHYDPEYFSVTYGAGGSTQTHTQKAVTTIAAHTAVDIAPHISCIDASPDAILSLLNTYQAAGIHRLVVLRGDQPADTPITHHDFSYAADLVKFIRDQMGNAFHIEVAVYPECHPETLDMKRHMAHFKEKVNAGADAAITQYFYNSDAYFYLLDDCKKQGIHTPIVPGIMPITQYAQLSRFSRLCGAEIPRWLDIRLQNHQDDPDALLAIGTEFLSRLCERLIAGGAPGLHFYTLNKAEPSKRILKNLGIEHQVAQSA